MLTPINVFKKLSPEAQVKVLIIETRLYNIQCEKAEIDKQLKELPIE